MKENVKIKSPKVGVIMSVYNGEKYLKEAIESILNQTFRDFEFIIVNDGSIDKTEDILDDYAKQDSRMKIIKNRNNIGLTKSLNKAIQDAKGEYIARMDADDISLPKRLEKQVKFMEKNPKVGLLGVAYYQMNSKGEIVGKNIFPISNKKLQKALIKYNHFFHASVMIRKNILNEAGLYNENIKSAQDYDLWFRIARVSKIANLSEFLMIQRYSMERISINYKNKQMRSSIKIRKNAIRKGQYPLWCYIYLIRPYILLILPFKVRNFLREHILRKIKIYR